MGQRVAVFFAGLLLVLSCQANDRFIVLPEIEPFYGADGQGAYNKILAEIGRRSGIDIRIESYPLARAVLVFSSDPDSCYIVSAGMAEHLLGLKFVENAERLNTGKVVFATPQSSNTPTSLSEFRNANIAILIGEPLALYDLDDLNINFQEVRSHEQSIKLLELGRVDAIMGSMVELIPYADGLALHEQIPITTYRETITCHSSQASRNFLRQLDPVIHSMRADGSLSRLLGEYLID